MKKCFASHYDYLEEHLLPFFDALGHTNRAIFNKGIIVAHGDKCYGYQDAFEAAGIPFYKGVAIYLLTYFQPYSKEVREVGNTWVDPQKWVIDNKDRFLPYLPG